MKNIYEILKSFGVEIPSEKKEAFEKEVLENYKTISEVKGIQGKLTAAEQERDSYKSKYDTDIKKRDEDLKDLQKKLKDVGADNDKLKTLQLDLDNLQETYNNEKANYEKQLAKQAYEFAVKEKASALKFSSNSAKKAFIADAIREEMKMKDGELQGFDDFVDSYKKNDAEAFIKEETNKQKPEDKPQFSSKSTGKDQKSDEDNGTNKTSVTFW